MLVVEEWRGGLTL